MVVAHLRGLLQPNLKHGLRSTFSENVIFEALNAEGVADDIRYGVAADVALIPVINEKAIGETISRTNSRLSRARELKCMDIYKVRDQLAGRIKIRNDKKEISLFQVYQIAEEQGIFDAFDEHYTEENSKPLL